MRLVFHQRVNLDDYYEEVLRKIDRSCEVMRKVLDDELEVDARFINKLEDLQKSVKKAVTRMRGMIWELASIAPAKSKRKENR